MYFDLIHSPQLIADSPQLPYPPNFVFSLKKKKKSYSPVWGLYQSMVNLSGHTPRNQVSPNTYISTMYRCFKSVVLRRCMRTQCSWLGKGQKSHVKPQLNGSVHPGLNTLLLIHCIAPSHSVIKTWQTGTHLHWSSGE